MPKVRFDATKSKRSDYARVSTAPTKRLISMGSPRAVLPVCFATNEQVCLHRRIRVPRKSPC